MALKGQAKMAKVVQEITTRISQALDGVEKEQAKTKCKREYMRRYRKEGGRVPKVPNPPKGPGLA